MESIEQRGDGQLISNLVGVGSRYFDLLLMLMLLFFVQQRELEQHFKANAGKLFAQFGARLAIHYVRTQNETKEI